MATTAGVWGWTLAGVWARFGLLLVPGGVFLPGGVLAAATGTKGDRGRLLGAAGDGALVLALGVLLGGRQVRAGLGPLEPLRGPGLAPGSRPASGLPRWYLLSALDLCTAAPGDAVCLLFWTASFVRALLSFSFSRSLSFFSFFFLSTFQRRGDSRRLRARANVDATVPRLFVKGEKL